MCMNALNQLTPLNISHNKNKPTKPKVDPNAPGLTVTKTKR